jgi:prevent-host-death family protein
MSRDAWTVAGAKAKFSELIQKAKSEGPQKITKHGRTAVVIVATEEWERKTRRKANLALAEFLASSALPRSRLRLKGLSLPAAEG